MSRMNRKHDIQRTHGYSQPRHHPRQKSLYMVIHPIIAVRIMTHPYTPSILFSPPSRPPPYSDNHPAPHSSFHRRSPLLLHGTAHLSPLLSLLSFSFLLSTPTRPSIIPPHPKASDENLTGYNGHSMDRPIKGEYRRLFLFVPHTANSEGGTFSPYPLLWLDAYRRETRVLS
jgi:hypothetical protein